MRKKLGVLFLVGALICTNVVPVQAQALETEEVSMVAEERASSITLYVNDRKVETTAQAPVNIDGRVLVPTREVFEALGASVQWQGAAKQVTIKYKKTQVLLKVNDREGFVNGKSTLMDVPTQIINNKVLIPIRFVSEAIGLKVNWAAKERAVRITEPVNIDDSTSNDQGSSGESESKMPKITNITMNEVTGELIATITAQAPLQDASIMTMPGRVVIDINGSINGLASSITPVSNTYVHTIRTSQFTANATRIVFDLLTDAVTVNKKLSSDSKQVVISLKKQGEGQTGGNTGNNTPTTPNEPNKPSEPTVPSPVVNPGLKYEQSGSPMIYLNQIKGLSLNQIKVIDNYRNKQLVFDLGANYGKYLPSGTKTVGDGFVKNIVISTKATTTITVNTATIYTYEMSAKDGNVQIQLMRPSKKYDKIVVLDIGHGGADGGAVANNLKEKDINFDQGMALFRLLEADKNIKVYMTRETDIYPTLQFRATLANEIEADLFVSIHNNSAGPNITGAETLYFPSSTDLRGKKVAQLMQDVLVKDCGMGNRGIKARSDLYVLRNTNMPAVLLETGFISNAQEALKISSPSFIATWAKGMYHAIVKSFEIL